MKRRRSGFPRRDPLDRPSRFDPPTPTRTIVNTTDDEERDARDARTMDASTDEEQAYQPVSEYDDTQQPNQTERAVISRERFFQQAAVRPSSKARSRSGNRSRHSEDSRHRDYSWPISEDSYFRKSDFRFSPTRSKSPTKSKKRRDCKRRLEETIRRRQVETIRAATVQATVQAIQRSGDNFEAGQAGGGFC